jgi:formylglycine-generating enzyme required for sulfatase activity
VRPFLLSLAALVLAAGAAGAAPEYVRVPGGEFRSMLPQARQQETVLVRPFSVMATPVTNQEFLAFVTRRPEWRRGAVAKIFADDEYLRHWAGPLSLGPAADPRQSVTRVSWFAAEAYCEDAGARLPAWNEWEYVAAASETSRDARKDAAWRQRILDWYATPASGPLPHVGEQPPNAYGVRDLHGVVWEWVEDFNSLLVSGDNREQGDPDRGRFCGAGALSLEQKENYAVMMRIAMLSSLRASYTTAALGFRCARDEAGS